MPEVSDGIELPSFARRIAVVHPWVREYLDDPEVVADRAAGVLNRFSGLLDSRVEPGHRSSMALSYLVLRPFAISRKAGRDKNESRARKAEPNSRNAVIQRVLRTEIGRTIERTVSSRIAIGDLGGNEETSTGTANNGFTRTSGLGGKEYFPSNPDGPIGRPWSQHRGPARSRHSESSLIGSISRSWEVSEHASNEDERASRRPRTIPTGKTLLREGRRRWAGERIERSPQGDSTLRAGNDPLIGEVDTGVPRTGSEGIDTVGQPTADLAEPLRHSRGRTVAPKGDVRVSDRLRLISGAPVKEYIAGGVLAQESTGGVRRTLTGVRHLVAESALRKHPKLVTRLRDSSGVGTATVVAQEGSPVERLSARWERFSSIIRGMEAGVIGRTKGGLRSRGSEADGARTGPGIESVFERPRSVRESSQFGESHREEHSVPVLAQRSERVSSASRGSRFDVEPKIGNDRSTSHGAALVSGTTRKEGILGLHPETAAVFGREELSGGADVPSGPGEFGIGTSRDTENREGHIEQKDDGSSPVALIVERSVASEAQRASTERSEETVSVADSRVNSGSNRRYPRAGKHREHEATARTGERRNGIGERRDDAQLSPASFFEGGADLDRLVDRLYRELERKMRIERERRGR